MGFVLTPEQAQALIAKDPRNRDVLFPFLNGEDLNSRPDQSPSRWIINFFDWPIEKAKQYPDCFRIVEEKVKPERMRLKPGTNEFALRKPLPQKWWHYAEKRPALYRTIAGLERVLFHSFTSKYLQFAFAPHGYVYAGPHNVFAIDTFGGFALVQNSFHDAWVFSNCSTMETRMRYATDDLFETFPFPENPGSRDPGSPLDEIGERYHAHRQSIMLARQEGLTKTYNRFHDRGESSADIQKLRELHVEMDQAVAAAYGWTETGGLHPPLALGHGFHETKQGVRFTISEPARREVLQRLLKLNHERYAAEVKQGLHSKKKGAAKKAAPKKKTASKPAKQEASLFDGEDDE